MKSHFLRKTVGGLWSFSDDKHHHLSITICEDNKNTQKNKSKN